MKFGIIAALLGASSASKTASQLLSEALLHVEADSQAHNLMRSAIQTMAHGDEQILNQHSQYVAIPIDEKRALTVRVSPTYVLDEINSVTLKSFRKIVGYDTFESIRRKNRNEAKDTSDYYNVTVSMMVRRKPAEASAAPARDPYAPDGAPSLAATLDKGFPYDD